MSQASEKLDLSVLQSKLQTKHLGKAIGWSNELWDTIDSTNTRAAELASQGAPSGMLVLARKQEAGRGRHGRVWVSPTDSGIYMSFLLKPEVPDIDLPLHTLACGVACIEAIKECTGLSIGLKWVNDLIVNGKKIGGILAEIPKAPYLVIGIGININLDFTQVPDDLKTKIDSINNLIGEPVDPNILVAKIAYYLELTLELLAKDRQRELLNKWRQYSITLGKQIHAISGNTEIKGLAIDIDQFGGLIVETADKKRVTLHAGEISIRGLDGYV